jgi:hypothetical protein
MMKRNDRSNPMACLEEEEDEMRRQTTEFEPHDWKRDGMQASKQARKKLLKILLLAQLFVGEDFDVDCLQQSEAFHAESRVLYLLLGSDSFHHRANKVRHGEREIFTPPPQNTLIRNNKSVSLCKIGEIEIVSFVRFELTGSALFYLEFRFQ